jgi:primosomal replication protein N
MPIMRFAAAIFVSAMATACFGSGEPTDQDLRAALDQHLTELKRMSTVPAEITVLDFSKTRCVKQAENAFDCLVATTIRVTARGETKEAKQHYRTTIAKESVGWVRQKSELMNPS